VRARHTPRLVRERSDVRAVDESTRLRVGPLEAIDGTPVLDIKPVLDTARER
jgi:tRNA (Thr-GGU) A37 N-methylase